MGEDENEITHVHLRSKEKLNFREAGRYTRHKGFEWVGISTLRPLTRLLSVAYVLSDGHQHLLDGSGLFAQAAPTVGEPELNVAGGFLFREAQAVNQSDDSVGVESAAHLALASFTLTAGEQ